MAQDSKYSARREGAGERERERKIFVPRRGNYGDDLPGKPEERERFVHSGGRALSAIGSDRHTHGAQGGVVRGAQRGEAHLNNAGVSNYDGQRTTAAGHKSKGHEEHRRAARTFSTAQRVKPDDAGADSSNTVTLAAVATMGRRLWWMKGSTRSRYRSSSAGSCAHAALKQRTLRHEKGARGQQASACAHLCELEARVHGGREAAEARLAQQRVGLQVIGCAHHAPRTLSPHADAAP